jgi:hypothetical protein
MLAKPSAQINDGLAGEAELPVLVTRVGFVTL